MRKSSQQTSSAALIVVDDREARVHSETVDRLVAVHGLQIRVERLTYGDFAIMGLEHAGRHISVGIEVSTVSDLCGKITSGRLSYQAAGLLQTYDVPVLLVAGPPRVYGEHVRNGPSIFSYARLEAVLFGAQAHGMRIAYATSAEPRHVASRIAALAEYYGKKSHDFFRVTSPKLPLTLPLSEALDRRVEMLMSIPGVGEEKARALLMHFGSVKAVALATEKELRDVSGVGPTLARRVAEFFEESASGV